MVSDKFHGEAHTFGGRMVDAWLDNYFVLDHLFSYTLVEDVFKFAEYGVNIFVDTHKDPKSVYKVCETVENKVGVTITDPKLKGKDGKGTKPQRIKPKVIVLDNLGLDHPISDDKCSSVVVIQGPGTPIGDAVKYGRIVLEEVVEEVIEIQQPVAEQCDYVFESKVSERIKEHYKQHLEMVYEKVVEDVIEISTVENEHVTVDDEKETDGFIGFFTKHGMYAIFGLFISIVLGVGEQFLFNIEKNYSNTNGVEDFHVKPEIFLNTEPVVLPRLESEKCISDYYDIIQELYHVSNFDGNLYGRVAIESSLDGIIGDDFSNEKSFEYVDIRYRLPNSRFLREFVGPNSRTRVHKESYTNVRHYGNGLRNNYRMLTSYNHDHSQNNTEANNEQSGSDETSTQNECSNNEHSKNKPGGDVNDQCTSGNLIEP